MKILVTYDGTLQSKDALRYGLFKAHATGGSLIALYVFHSGMYVGYDSYPMAEKMARKDSDQFIKEAEEIISEKGMMDSAKVMQIDGIPEEEYINMANSGKADIIIATPKYRSIAKNAACPVSIVPGTLLVPLDGQVDMNISLRTVADEAAASKSDVMLLGAVPIHIYNKWENEELKKHESRIKKAIGALKKALEDSGITAKELMVSGYPDEEILKAAGKISLTAIIIPEEGGIPSEVRKAAALISEESDNLSLPLLFA